MKESVFKKLSSLDISKVTQVKNKHKYIAWANAWKMVKAEYPDTKRTVYTHSQTELPYFEDGRSGIVKVGVTINGVEEIIWHPIMDFRNQSILLDKLTTKDVNDTIQRATVKALGMHGYGLDHWIKEDYMVDPFEDAKQDKPQTKSASKPKSSAVTKEKATLKPKPSAVAKEKVTLKINDDNWKGVLNYVAANQDLSLAQIVKNLQLKYKIEASVKKELSKHIK